MKKKLFLLLAIVSVVGMIAISGCGKEKVYRVTFDANGGTGKMKEQAFAKERPQVLVSNAFLRIGYLFVGWNTVSDGSGDSYTDAQEIVLDEDITLFAQWKAHEWVDLGLPSGTKWATYNVGATKPEEFGDYFAWGETEPKETYNWSTYRYCNGSENRLTKYCSYSSHGDDGFTDALTTLEACDDAATANWGPNWRMPTKEDFSELLSNCNREWITQNDVNGEKFTGPNGNFIFLPAAGGCVDSSFGDDGSDGYYWSGGRHFDSYAWCFDFSSVACNVFELDRYFGLSVRAVCSSLN